MSWMQIARVDAIPLLFTWMQTYTGNSQNGEMAQTLTNGEYQIWLVIYTIPIRVLYIVYQKQNIHTCSRERSPAKIAGP